jgi:hypothetical protein
MDQQHCQQQQLPVQPQQQEMSLPAVEFENDTDADQKPEQGQSTPWNQSRATARQKTGWRNTAAIVQRD